MTTSIERGLRAPRRRMFPQALLVASTWTLIAPGAGPGSALPVAAHQSVAGITLVVYWGVRCPHCEASRPFVEALAERYPDLAVEWVEIQRDAAGRRRYLKQMESLGVSGAGVPTFVVGDTAIVGFSPGRTEAEVRRAIEAAAGAASAASASPTTLVEVPLFGSIDSRAVSFPVFTVMVGLVDGLNPCAFWVLTVMMSLLLRVRSRLRLALFGGLFVAMSGLVYFLFMTAWAAMFTLAGMSLALTRGLGAALLGMGLINLKELIWFGQGPSLMIPDRVKPGIYGRMRAIANAASLPSAVAGIAALAFVVNLIELGCTVGLPAVYTRILTLQPGLGSTERYAYLALYNVAYIVPLGLVVVVYAATLHRFSLSERGAKTLKTISGLLLVSFGILFLVRPNVLG